MIYVTQYSNEMLLKNTYIENKGYSKWGKMLTVLVLFTIFMFVLILQIYSYIQIKKKTHLSSSKAA